MLPPSPINAIFFPHYTSFAKACPNLLQNRRRLEFCLSLGKKSPATGNFIPQVELLPTTRNFSFKE